MGKTFAYTLAALMAISAVSCVSARKYKSLKDTSTQFMNERDDLKTANIGLEMANKELEAKLSGIQKQADSISKDMAKTSEERDKSVDDYNKILSRYNELQEAHEDLIKGNVKDTQKLLSDLQAAQENNQKKEDLLKQLQESLDTKKTSLDELSYELEKRNAKLSELQKILDAQKKIVTDLKNKVSEALMGYENDALTVTMKDGKVYVSLEEKLLFKTARWDVDANGRNALKKLSVVLEKNPDIQITIEGHTDNVPYHPEGGQLKDNWDLSVKRATSVVRVLLEGTKIDPKRLTASGHSEYMPVEANNSAESRQKNRRTDIVLTPDLTSLYDMINKY